MNRNEDDIANDPSWNIILRSSERLDVARYFYALGHTDGAEDVGLLREALSLAVNSGDFSHATKARARAEAALRNTGGVMPHIQELD